ncbi:MAG: beta-N-acetylglucosaminidase domain-containing protein, partial [Acidimicrobiales bacterium]
MTNRLAGVIEGFYGPPWSWAARREVADWCAARGMHDYVYAPKDDPKHRERWREPYDAAELAGFAGFAEEGALRLGFAISPGLSIDYDDDGDRAALAAKIDQVVGVGAELVVLALDDIPFGGGPQGEAHARLTTWLRDHLGDAVDLVLVPTEYVGTRPSPHLDALAAGVPDDVPIAWTGRAVVNDE